MIGKIHAIALAGPTTILVQWDDGQMGLVAFEEILQTQPTLAPLLDHQEFKEARLSSDGWSIEWPSGVELGSSQLRRWSGEQGRVLEFSAEPQKNLSSQGGSGNVPYPEWQRRFEIDKALFEGALADAATSQKYVIDFATMALRTLSIANGGAIIGMLTFVGNFPELIVRQSPLWWGFALLSVGLAFTIASMFYAYLSQGFAGNAAIRQSHRIYFQTLAMSYVGGRGAYGKSLETAARNVDRDGDIDRTLAQILASHAVACSIAAFCAFCAGVGTAIGAVVERFAPMI